MGSGCLFCFTAKTGVGTASRRLTVFISIIRDNDFDQTTRRLKRTGSTMDQTIGGLRVGLNIDLLGQAAQRLDLARRNRHCFHHMRSVLRRVTTTRSRVVRAHGAPHKLLHVSTTAPIILRFLVPLVGPFHRHCPRIALSLISSRAVVGLVREGISITVHTNALASSDLHTEPLFGDCQGVVTSPSCVSHCKGPRAVSSLGRRVYLKFARPTSLGA